MKEYLSGMGDFGPEICRKMSHQSPGIGSELRIKGLPAGVMQSLERRCRARWKHTGPRSVRRLLGLKIALAFWQTPTGWRS